MLGRSETYIHLVVQFILCSITIFGIIFSFHFGFFCGYFWGINCSGKYINILLSFFIALAFIFIIPFDGNKQEKQINSALGEIFFIGRIISQG